MDRRISDDITIVLLSNDDRMTVIGGAERQIPRDSFFAGSRSLFSKKGKPLQFAQNSSDGPNIIRGRRTEDYVTLPFLCLIAESRASTRSSGF